MYGFRLEGLLNRLPHPAIWANSRRPMLLLTLVLGKPSIGDNRHTASFPITLSYSRSNRDRSNADVRGPGTPEHGILHPCTTYSY